MHLLNDKNLFLGPFFISSIQRIVVYNLYLTDPVEGGGEIQKEQEIGRRLDTSR